MFATSGDILNISLALGFIVLVIFLSILIFYAILVLRDVSKVVSEMEELVTKVHGAVIQPIRLMDSLLARFTPFVETVIEKVIMKRKGRK